MVNLSQVVNTFLAYQCPCTTTKFSHIQNHNHKKFSMIQHHIPNKYFPYPKAQQQKFLHVQNYNHKIFHDLTSHTQQKYFHSQNFMPTKFFRTHKIFPYLYPQKFAINYTCQQIFHIHHDFGQPSLHNKFFMTSMPPKIQAKVHPTNIRNYQHCQNFMISMIPKFKPKFIQQHHKLPTWPKFHGFNAP